MTIWDEAHFATEDEIRREYERDRELEANWRIHTPNLLKEIFANPGTDALARPFQIFGNTLFELAEYVTKLEDPILHEFMCRLTLFSMADPESPDYDEVKLRIVRDRAKAARRGINEKAT